MLLVSRDTLCLFQNSTGHLSNLCALAKLLGLHLLGIGYSSSLAVAKPAALARNTTQHSSSSTGGISTALSQNSQAYRHPIAYDKLTGVSNNQINDVLGKQQGQQPANNDYPIDHYQQSLGTPIQRQFGANPMDSFFGREPPSLASNPFGPPARLHGSNMAMMGPLQPPPPPPPPPQQLVPVGRQSTPQPRSSFAASSLENQPDSQPSASSNNGAARVPTNGSATAHQLAPLTVQQQQQQLIQPQPVYYTPPIFAYNSVPDQGQNRLGEPFGFGAQQQPLAPPLGVPEVPLSVEDYQARQARLRQLQQSQLALSPGEPSSQSDRYGRPVVSQRQGQLANPELDQNANLLANPQQQARHKQQMLNLFRPDVTPAVSTPPNQTSYYPDSSLLYRQPGSLMSAVAPSANRAPPYAHNLVNTGASLDSAYAPKTTTPQARIVAPTTAPPPTSQLSAPSRLLSTAPERGTAKSASGQQVQVSLPACARQLGDTGSSSNVSLANQQGSTTIMLCSEDPEYPTNEIMRALELYANERTIEQLLPQLLLQIHMAAQRATESGPAVANRNLMGDLQRQLTLDSLQPSISLIRPTPAENGQQVSTGEPATAPIALFPSANYEPMCRSSAYMAQPRRAKNLLGQWKVVVNLPGHKYRGIAISQMLRIEECSRPNSECSAPPQPQQQQRALLGANSATTPLPLLARSRCLQHYENQRLVAWSHQQGLHLDIFRVPIACSCHIRR